MTVWIVAGVVAVLFVSVLIFGNRKTIKITDPSVGFLNLIGAAASQFLQEDRAAVRPSFHSVSESDTTAPLCDVLFLYAEVGADGSLAGTDHSLRQLIADSGAKIVIVAVSNPDKHYIAALKPAGARANIV